MRTIGPALLAALLLAACATTDDAATAEQDAASPSAGKGDHAFGGASDLAGRLVLYEIQVRSANACRADLGADWQREACAEKVAPTIPYRAEGMSCSSLDDLQRIRLGTLDDLLEDTADFRAGITLRYVADRVGARAVWLMPLFPNNDTWNIPDACDNLGSPYAVRDYMHARGTLARSCILAGRDEWSDDPCWGNDALDAVIADAHARGLRVMLDVAFNHFGHNYVMYDTAAESVRERVAAGDNLDGLWDFGATEEPALIEPLLMDTEKAVRSFAASDAGAANDLASLEKRCKGLGGQTLVRAFHAWRAALDAERASFPCSTQYLEAAVPGFYLGADRWSPSKKLGDGYTNDWKDVKFLYHHTTNLDHRHELWRNREYLFRVLNYWSSRGVDGFRLDHTTEDANGLSPETWRYVAGKLAHYAALRGQERPVLLAEEFHDQQGMAKVVDIMTEGYVRDMTGRNGATKDAGRVEWIVENTARFGDGALVMTALETHDEHRLTDGTGFDAWTGAGFWGIGATVRSTPMLLMGQELGEPWGLGFRRSDLLRSRFDGSPNQPPDADALVDFYGAMARTRLDPKNRALLSRDHAFLRTRTASGTDSRIFAEARWSDDANVVLVFHNLWRQNVSASYYLPPDVTKGASILPGVEYRLVDAFTDEVAQDCRPGSDLAWSLPIVMDAETRLQWLRLEACAR